MVSQYSGEPRRRSTSRDQEDERAGQDNGGRGTPPTLEKGARILAAPPRLSAQDRARDTGGRAGSSPLGHVAAGHRSVDMALFVRLFHFAGLARSHEATVSSDVCRQPPPAVVPHAHPSRSGSAPVTTNGIIKA